MEVSEIAEMGACHLKSKMLPVSSKLTGLRWNCSPQYFLTLLGSRGSGWAVRRLAAGTCSPAIIYNASLFIIFAPSDAFGKEPGKIIVNYWRQFSKLFFVPDFDNHHCFWCSVGASHVCQFYRSCSNNENLRGGLDLPRVLTWVGLSFSFLK